MEYQNQKNLKVKIQAHQRDIQEGKECTFIPEINNFVSIRTHEKFYKDMMEF